MLKVTADTKKAQNLFKSCNNDIIVIVGWLDDSLCINLEIFYQPYYLLLS